MAASNKAAKLRGHVRERLREQRRLVRTLLALREQVQGSVFGRYGRCGKPDCACRGARPHGPYYVLSGASGGRGFAYLERGQLGRARVLVRRSREFRRGLRRLRTLNRDLVLLLRRYQHSTLARGLERLQVSTPATRKS